MLAAYVINTGHLSTGGEFAEHSLLTGWVNSFYDDFGSPVIVAVLSIVTGKDTLYIETLPIYAPAMILVQSVLATTIVGKRDVFPVALAGATFYKFLAPHTFSNAHRGGFAWTMLLLTLLAVVLAKRQPSRSTVLLLLFAAVLPMAAHTLPVAALLLLFILFLLNEVLGRQMFGYKRAALVAIVILAYNLFVSTWVGRVVFKFTVATSSVSEPITLSTLVQSVTRSAAVHSSLFPYLIDGAPPEFQMIVIISVATAAAITVIVVLYRLRQLLKSRSIEDIQTFDIVIGAVGIQAIAYISIIPFFAPSGGINPPLLGLMFFPIFLGKFSDITRRINLPAVQRQTWVSIGLIILILIPGAIASVANPMTVGKVNSFTEDEYQTLEWVSKHDSNRLVTDFDTASTYYAIGGRSSTYLPPPGEPAYATEEATSRIIQIHYTNPGLACTKGGTYLVTERMTDVGLIHLGSLVTKPNTNIRSTVRGSPKFNLVFETKDSFVATCD
ncbi:MULTISPECIES: hypothetical protein [Haloferax]|uniref:Uncharacterized protein n=2 Tax=Haloferax TaxID=2251 RepID=A0A6G1Z1A4_9EURY|nr:MULTISPECIES: hypothetical protein [Haloferax]KAB1187519.1 hypothetical protein Hfx1149_05525 [Haloferax sp. CBA1149]MRW80171.1 hypothetical protein [Haloferax marinisediminis]